LSQFEKHSGDKITPEEFYGHLRRRNIDGNFSADDQKLFFEKFDKSGKSAYINIDDVSSFAALICSLSIYYISYFYSLSPTDSRVCQ
jgi:hypothetical protein